MTAKGKGTDVLKDYYAGINAMPAPKAMGPERANAEMLREALRDIYLLASEEQMFCISPTNKSIVAVADKALRDTERGE